MITGPTIAEQCADALARLKHSIGTSAGMHKRQIRLQAAVLRVEAAARMPELRHFWPASAVNLAAGEI